eukprot:610015-Rhodomonas_salina.3
MFVKRGGGRGEAGGPENESCLTEQICHFGEHVALTWFDDASARLCQRLSARRSGAQVLSVSSCPSFSLVELEPVSDNCEGSVLKHVSAGFGMMAGSEDELGEHSCDEYMKEL